MMFKTFAPADSIEYYDCLMLSIKSKLGFLDSASSSISIFSSDDSY